MNSLGAIAYRAGHHERARIAFEEALPCFRAVEDRRNTAQVLTNLGYVALAEGEVAQAGGIFAESLAFGREHNDRFIAPACLRGLAAVALAHEEPVQTVSLLAAAAALFTATGARRWPAERLSASVDIDRLRARLGEEAFAAVWDAGRGSPEAMIATALTHLA